MRVRPCAGLVEGRAELLRHGLDRAVLAPHRQEDRGLDLRGKDRGSCRAPVGPGVFLSSSSIPLRDQASPASATRAGAAASSRYRKGLLSCGTLPEVSSQRPADEGHVHAKRRVRLCGLWWLLVDCCPGHPRSYWIRPSAFETSDDFSPANKGLCKRPHDGPCDVSGDSKA